jgi:hypothetical protein
VEADAGLGQFALDERVAIEPIGGLEGEKGGHADEDRPQQLVQDIEVVGG